MSKVDLAAVAKEVGILTEVGKPASRKGLLSKQARTGIFTRWQPRHFVLQGTELKYGETEGGPFKDAFQTADIPSATKLTFPEKSGKSHCLMLESGKGEQMLLAAKTAEDLLDWAAKLQYAINSIGDQQKKNSIASLGVYNSRKPSSPAASQRKSAASPTADTATAPAESPAASAPAAAASAPKSSEAVPVAISPASEEPLATKPADTGSAKGNDADTLNSLRQFLKNFEERLAKVEAHSTVTSAPGGTVSEKQVASDVAAIKAAMDAVRTHLDNYNKQLTRAESATGMS
jgi:hypothetical protein